MKTVNTIMKTSKTTCPKWFGAKAIRSFYAPLSVLACVFMAPGPLGAQTEDEHVETRVVFRAAELENFKLAFKVLDLSGNKLWPNWHKSSRKTWYVSNGSEFYFCSEDHPEGYQKVSLIKVAKNCDIYAKPTNLKDWEVSTTTLSTKPPMVIIGSPRRKNVLWMPWVTAWLHEHTHQWQMSMDGYGNKVKDLGLGIEDDKGKGMVQYAFPYDDNDNNQNYTRMAERLITLLDILRSKAAPAKVRKGVYKYLEAKLAFRNNISENDYKFFAFTNWQEGIARYTEYRALQIALKVSSWKKDKKGHHPIVMIEMKKLAKMADYSYHKMISDLANVDLADDKHVAFYAIGAVEAIVLDKLVKNWRKGYLDHPFQLDWAFETWFKRTHDLTEADLGKDKDDEATMAWKRFFKNDTLQE